MTSPFKFAHAAHADWTQAAQACMSQLGAIPSAATLGFLYVSDTFAGEIDAILAFFRSATGVPHWTGSVGVGVCATGMEYLEAPALAVMLGEFEPADFSMLPVMRSPQDIEAQPADAYFAVAHGDPANNRIQELIESLSAHVSSGFVVGGLSSSRGETVQISDGVVSGGLSGVLFSARVKLATRLTQGISPLGPRHRITTANKNIIGSLDHRPATGCDEGRDRRSAGARLAACCGIHLRRPAGARIGYRRLPGAQYSRRRSAEQPGGGWRVCPARDELSFCRCDQQTAEEDMQRTLSAIGA